MSERTLTFGALILIQILFGISYPVSKMVLEHFPALVWASIRIVCAALIMLAAALIVKRPHPKADVKFFAPLVLFALLGCVINQGSSMLGLKYTTATNSAILNTLIPIFTLMIVTLLGYEKLSLNRAMGFALAFIGVLSIRHVETMTFNNDTFIGDLLTILNCLSYATFLAISKRFMGKYDRIWTTIWMFLYGSIGLSLISLPGWQEFHFPVINNTLLFAMLYVIIGGTILTYFLNIWTLARVKSSSVAIFIYLQPLVAIPLAWIFFGEIPTTRTLLSMTLIFFGMVIARERRPT